MSKLTISESTLRRDLSRGKVSSEKDRQGRRRIDTAELIRGYGELKTSNEQSTQSDAFVRESQVNAPDT